jgi:RNA polymerase sigma factor (sigma-70 family)
VQTVDLSGARDRELVRRVGDGDEDAFRRLFRRYGPTALGLARRIVRQPFLAEEIVQEVFLAVWRDPGGYDPERGSVRAWLMGMTHHRAVDAVRREEASKRRATESLPETDVEDPAVVVVEELGIPEGAQGRPFRVGRVARRATTGDRADVLPRTLAIEDRGAAPAAARHREVAHALGMRRLRAALLGMER